MAKSLKFKHLDRVKAATNLYWPVSSRRENDLEAKKGAAGAIAEVSTLQGATFPYRQNIGEGRDL